MRHRWRLYSHGHLLSARRARCVQATPTFLRRNTLRHLSSVRLGIPHAIVVVTVGEQCSPKWRQVSKRAPFRRPASRPHQICQCVCHVKEAFVRYHHKTMDTVKRSALEIALRRILGDPAVTHTLTVAPVICIVVLSAPRPHDPAGAGLVRVNLCLPAVSYTHLTLPTICSV